MAEIGQLLANVTCDAHDTAIVSAELERAYSELVLSRRHPERYRRSFEEYVHKSQQLTEVMRVEYKRYTGCPWSARRFPNWNPHTEVLKALRRAIFHRAPLTLDPVEVSVYPREAIESMFPGSLQFRSSRHRNSKYGLVKGTSFVGNPFEKTRTPSRMGIPRQACRPTSVADFWFPLKTFMSYEISHRLVNDDLDKCLVRAGTRDTCVIVLRTFPALREYYEYFLAEFETNRLM